MAKPKNNTRNKVRITEEQVTEMKRLFREGMPISAIAKKMRCHRQTVSIHIAEKHGDLVADEVRKQILGEELRLHFKQLTEFARDDLTLRLHASVPEYQTKEKIQTQRQIFTGGLLGLPYQGGPQHMTREWIRMYNPSPRESHLLKSLREHTENSTMWVYWDRWRGKVVGYENASKGLWVWLSERLEEDLPDKINPLMIDSLAGWIFGDILRIASGVEQENLATFRRHIFDPEGMIIAREPDEDTDGSLTLYQYQSGILKEIKNRPEYSVLESATTELSSKETQRELRRVIKDMDHALVAVELMHAFPGHCELCPV